MYLDKAIEMWLTGLAATIVIFFIIGAILWICSNMFAGSVVLGVIFIPTLLGWLILKWENKNKAQ